MSVFNPFCKSRKLMREGGVGYTEKPVITFDGNTDGLPTLLGLYCRISDSVDLNTVTSVTVVTVEEAVSITFDEFEAKDGGETDFCTQALYPKEGSSVADDAIMVCIEKNIDEVPNGLYVVCDPEGEAYVSRIEFAETIHTIDPKYLPGVCLPVVELTTALPTDTNTTVPLSDEENNALNTCLANGSSLIIVEGMSQGIGAGVFKLFKDGSIDGYVGYVPVSAYNLYLTMVCEDGVWAMM